MSQKAKPDIHSEVCLSRDILSSTGPPPADRIPRRRKKNYKTTNPRPRGHDPSRNVMRSALRKRRPPAEKNYCPPVPRKNNGPRSELPRRPRKAGKAAKITQDNWRYMASAHAACHDAACATVSPKKTLHRSMALREKRLPQENRHQEKEKRIYQKNKK